MTNPRHTATNAADSAPGVDDGRAGAPPPSVNSKPGARRPVFLIVAASLVILAIVFFARPRSSGPDEEFIGPAQTRGEVAASDAPGASPPQAPTQPAS